jgi:hypothetical protein
MQKNIKNKSESLSAKLKRNLTKAKSASGIIGKLGFKILFKSCMYITFAVLKIAGLDRLYKHVKTAYTSGVEMIPESIKTIQQDSVYHAAADASENNADLINQNSLIKKRLPIVFFYLILIFLWVALNAIYIKKISILVCIMQAYFAFIFIGYIIFCKYKIYQNTCTINSKDALSFVKWAKIKKTK